MPFPDTWRALQSNLSAGTIIPNWTAKHGLIGVQFTAAAVTSRLIVANAPGARKPQRVPITHFELVYDLWNGYCQGTVQRCRIRNSTRFSKYVISIFHWLENRSGDSLP